MGSYRTAQEVAITQYNSIFAENSNKKNGPPLKNQPRNEPCACIDQAEKTSWYSLLFVSFRSANGQVAKIFRPFERA